MEPQAFRDLWAPDEPLLAEAREDVRLQVEALGGPLAERRTRNS